MSLLDENRLFPVEPRTRGLAREIYHGIRDLPIISPHGHVDPSWFAKNEPFADGKWRPGDVFDHAGGGAGYQPDAVCV